MAPCRPMDFSGLSRGARHAEKAWLQRLCGRDGALEGACLGHGHLICWQTGPKIEREVAGGSILAGSVLLAKTKTVDVDIKAITDQVL